MSTCTEDHTEERTPETASADIATPEASEPVTAATRPPVATSDDATSQAPPVADVERAPARRGPRWVGALVLAALLAGLAGYVYRDRIFGAPADASAASPRKVLYWVDPMHP